MILKNAKILCVDDDPISLDLLQHVLSPTGCEVFKAGSGREALDVIARENIDLVLLDIVMPGMDGYEVCRNIKEVERTRNIPVVMITALLSKEDRIKGIEAGAEEFLTKPFDQAEVIARIRMLLKVKKLNEMRTGEILIDLGLINEAQLQEALRISKERNLKVGDALYSMGALSRDAIYWGLSNQLQMTYIELSPDMVDQDLIAGFSIEALKQLQCLPLYETNAEIHFAIADPTDQKSVEAIKNLRPGKAIQLHLGLPEKIADALSYYERDILQSPLSEKSPFPRRAVPLLPIETGAYPEPSRGEKSWGDLVAVLLTMPAAAVYWLDCGQRECRLLAKKKSAFEVVREYPDDVYSRFAKKMKHGSSPGLPNAETAIVLSDRSQNRPAAFRIRAIDALDRALIRIERIPTFSSETFEAAFSSAPRLQTETRSLFEEHRRLVVGGPDSSFIKQLGYAVLTRYSQTAGFPPVFFLERKINIFLPQAAQLSALQLDPEAFCDSVGEGVAPFLFYEAGHGETEPVAACLSGFLSGRLSNVILGLPAASPEAMRQVLKGYLDRSPRTFRSAFVDESRLESID